MFLCHLKLRIIYNNWTRNIILIWFTKCCSKRYSSIFISNYHIISCGNTISNINFANINELNLLKIWFLIIAKHFMVLKRRPRKTNLIWVESLSTAALEGAVLDFIFISQVCSQKYLSSARANAISNQLPSSCELIYFFNSDIKM